MVTHPAVMAPRIAIPLPAKRYVLLALAAVVALGLAWQVIPESATQQVVAPAAPFANALSDCAPGYCPLPMPLFP